MQAEIFVKAVLDHHKGGVAGLITMEDSDIKAPREKDWLEFKAAIFPIDGSYPPGTNKDYYSWNVAKAVIGMANTRGGVVLLGIDDNGEAVGLDPSDPDNDISRGAFDLFTRKTLTPAINCGKWNVESAEGKRRTVYSVRNPVLLAQSWEPYYYKFKERYVAAIIVKPVAFGSEDLIFVEDTANKNETVYCRQLGGGNTMAYWKKEDIENYIATRTDSNDYFDILFAKFGQTYFEEPAGLEESIEKYILKTRASLGKDTGDDVQLITLDVCNIKHDIQQTSHIPDDNSKRDAFHTEVFNSINLVDKGEFFIGNPRFILTGLPGSGKTCSIAGEFRKQIERYKRGGKVSVFIKLKDFDDKNGRLILYDFIKKETGFSIDECDYLLKTDRFFIFLDGLNECPCDSQTGCIRDIRNLICNFRRMPVVLTMRTRYWENQLEGLPVFEIMPMTMENREILFARFLDKPRAEAGKILTELSRKPGTDIITSNPLGLRLIAYIYKNHHVFELSNVSHLLKDFFEQWYDNTLSRSSLEGYQPVLSKIARLAGLMRLSGYSKSVHFDWINKNKYMGKEWTEDGGFLDKIAQGGLFEIDKERKSFSFYHECFNEYFAAEYLAGEPKSMSGFKLKEPVVKHMLMPFIYALELSNNKPLESLLDFFSKIKTPLSVPLVIIFTAEKKRSAAQAFNNFRNKSFWSFFIKGRYHKRYKLLMTCIKLFYGQNETVINDLPSNDMMNVFTDKPWRYFIETNPLAKARWEKFIKSIGNPRLATALVKYRLASADMFADKEEEFIKKANAKEAVKLYHYGIVKVAKFKHNPAAAIELLKSQPALHEEIKAHSSFWHNNATISQLRVILKSGLIEMPDSFKLKTARLINVCLNQ